MLRDVFTILGFACTGLAIVLGTHSFPRTSRPSLDPALFPRLIGVGLLLLALVEVVGVWKRRRAASQPVSEPERPAWPPLTAHARKTAITAVLTVGYGLSVLRVGFFATTIAFVTGAALVLGERSSKKALAYAVGFSVALYLVFAMFLRVPIARGLLI